MKLFIEGVHFGEEPISGSPRDVCNDEGGIGGDEAAGKGCSEGAGGAPVGGEESTSGQVGHGGVGGGGGGEGEGL